VLTRLEMIDEALKYQAEGKYDVVVKIMRDLHKKVNEPPESQNEIFFYQKYGMAIREAESYLLQYQRYRDPMSMVQACEVYIQLLKDIEDHMKGVETVESN
jgi:FKBP12-rapamycin binding domain